jgi:signal transduction histidine kinase
MQAHSQSSPAARNPELRNPFSAITHLGKETFVAPALTPRSSHPNLTAVHSASALTHDAGNILAALTLYCDLLEVPGVLAPHHLHYATELRALAQRSGQLLHQAVGRASSLPHTEPPCDAAATLRALAAVLNGLTQPLAELTLDLPAVPLVCETLAAQPLERIVLNLVRNAAQAIAHRPHYAQRGRIRVALTAASGFLRLSVQDNGTGLLPAQAAALLQPQPLPAGATRGFGHRIVHELASASGGSLAVRVKPGLGTTVSIKWPLAAREGRPC